LAGSLTGRTSKDAALVVVAVVVAGVAIIWWRSRGQPDRPDVDSSTRRQTTGPMTVVLTGDSLMVGPIQADDQKQRLSEVASLVGESTAAITNLEMTLVETPPARNPSGIAQHGWPFGTTRDAQELRRVGFNMVSCANNHALDYGPDRLRSTLAVLDKAAVVHAGCGEHLDAARAPVHIGDRPRRIALISVTATSDPEARATRQQGDILGRPGVNPLRYSADVVADSATFEVLQGTATAQEVTPTHITLAGMKIRKGDRTAVDFLAVEADAREIEDTIKAARMASDVVIVALHSHEPTNASQSPATFVQRFARRAIDAGAQIVMGHGPHQLRGIERYKDGLMLYSLGDFLYQRAATTAATPDAFDAGVDLYQLALGAVPSAGPLKSSAVPEDAWSESAVAIASFDGPALRSVRVVPLDLGIGLPAVRRGIPSVAGSMRARTILGRLSRLSKEFGTEIVQMRDTATISVRP
jgi:poly-gamma-glutamate synthesis protein (capsule biosynthesis protein)